MLRRIVVKIFFFFLFFSYFSISASGASVSLSPLFPPQGPQGAYLGTQGPNNGPLTASSAYGPLVPNLPLASNSFIQTWFIGNTPVILDILLKFKNNQMAGQSYLKERNSLNGSAIVTKLPLSIGVNNQTTEGGANTTIAFTKGDYLSIISGPQESQVVSFTQNQYSLLPSSTLFILQPVLSHSRNILYKIEKIAYIIVGSILVLFILIIAVSNKRHKVYFDNIN